MEQPDINILLAQQRQQIIELKAEIEQLKQQNAFLLEKLEPSNEEKIKNYL